MIVGPTLITSASQWDRSAPPSFSSKFSKGSVRASQSNSDLNLHTQFSTFSMQPPLASSRRPLQELAVTAAVHRAETLAKRTWVPTPIVKQSPVRPPVFVNQRFALWQSAPTSSATEPGQLLEQDQRLLSELPAKPFARLLLPLRYGPTHGAAAHHQWWFNKPQGSLADWTELAAAMRAHPRPRQFFVLSLFEQDAKQKTPPPSDVPGPVGSEVLFANDVVTLWDFRVPSMATCPLHEHRYPYVFINRCPGENLGLDAELKPTDVSSFRTGEFRYVDVEPTTEKCVHAFQNVAPHTLQQYIVEFKR